MSDKQLITDIGTSIQSAIESERYSQFFLMTHTLDEELLEWFPEHSRIAIHAPEAALTDIDLTRFPDCDITTTSDESHAKLYLAWNEHQIRCWLGSFNFTGDGLFSSLEWAADFEDSIDKPFDADELINGRLPETPTDHEVIDQVLDIASARSAAQRPSFAEDCMERPVPLTVTHTDVANTLKHAVSRVSERAEESLDVTYLTPFVNKRGVELFGNWASGIQDENLSIEVRTCNPDRIADTRAGYLRERDVGILEDRFKNFAIYRRKASADGSELADGTEIRDGFAHLKVIVCEYSRNGQTEHGVIFTSANLTRAAWQQQSDRFEIGLWVRDREIADEAISFFRDEMSVCYAQPDSEEFEEIEANLDQADASQGYKDRWLRELIIDDLTVDEGTAQITWPSSYPTLLTVDCRGHCHDIAAGESRTVQIPVRKEATSYDIELESIPFEPNEVIKRLEIDATTRFRSPERHVDPERLQHAAKAEGRTDWDIIISDGREYQFDSENLPTDVGSESVALRRLRDQPRKNTVRCEINHDGRFSNAFFEQITANTQEVANTPVLELEIKTTTSVEPPFDTIHCTTEQGDRCHPLGYAERSDAIVIYLHPRLSGQTITLAPAAPYQAWFDDKCTIDLPSVPTAVAGWIDTLTAETWTHQPATAAHVDNQLISTEELLSDTTTIEIFPPATAEIPHSLSATHYRYKREHYTDIYRPMSLNPISESLSKFPAYARVTYQGVRTYEADEHTIYLLTDTATFLVRKEITGELVSRNIVAEGMPHALTFDTMDPQDPIGWIVINIANLDLASLPDRLESDLQIEIWCDGRQFEMEDALATNGEHLVALPVIKQRAESGAEYTFVVRVKKSGQREAENYAARAEKVAYQTQKRRGRGLDIAVTTTDCHTGAQKEYKFPIDYDDEATAAALQHNQDSGISTKAFKREIEQEYIQNFDAKTADGKFLVTPHRDRIALRLRPRS